jgi:hypothetical protein
MAPRFELDWRTVMSYKGPMAAMCNSASRSVVTDVSDSFIPFDIGASPSRSSTRKTIHSKQAYLLLSP